MRNCKLIILANSKNSCYKCSNDTTLSLYILSFFSFLSRKWLDLVLYWRFKVLRLFTKVCTRSCHSITNNYLQHPLVLFQTSMRQVSLDRKNDALHLRKWPWRWIFPTKRVPNIENLTLLFISFFFFSCLAKTNFFFVISRYYDLSLFFFINFFEVYFSSEKLDFLLVQRPGCLLCRSCFQELQYESWKIDLYRAKPLHSEKGNRISPKSNNFERSTFPKISEVQFWRTNSSLTWSEQCTVQRNIFTIF